MHFSLATATPVMLAAWVGLATAQSASPTPTGRAALELEEERADCFRECYRDYGDLASCPFGAGEEVFEACWCTVDDWTEREEDCVRSVCGNDAYNEYHIIRPRMCETVAIPSSSPSTSPTASETTQSSAEETTTTAEPSGDETSATASPTGEEVAEESEDPNAGSALTWSSRSAVAAGVIAGFAYLML